LIIVKPILTIDIIKAVSKPRRFWTPKGKTFNSNIFFNGGTRYPKNYFCENRNI